LLRLSFFLQIPISSKGRDKLVFSDLYYDEIFNSKVNEDDQFYNLIFTYKLSEKINSMRLPHEKNFEILRNNYIGDVILSLASLYYLEDKKISPKISPKELGEVIKEIKYEELINKTTAYSLKDDSSLEKFILNIIKTLENILDVKKEARKEHGEEWTSKDTMNWLKKDSTYPEILEKVIRKLKQNI